MTDRRTWPANGRVALRSLGLEGPTPVDGTPARAARPVCDLCNAPSGRRERQVLFGEALLVLEDRDGWSFVQTANGYCGYVESGRLEAGRWPTHRVVSRGTHAYAERSIKSPDRMALPFGAQLRAIETVDGLVETTCGYVPASHLRPLDQPFADPVEVALLHLGVPYLWGGNSTRGIDCSGLVHAALTACDRPCPGDADLQEAAVGVPVDLSEPPGRGDLIFWKGHVGMMVDENTMVHANAHAMAVTLEDLSSAIARIRTQGGGDVTARRRPG